MPAAGDGTGVEDVRRSSGCSGFPVALSIDGYRLQLVLLYAWEECRETLTAAMEAPSSRDRRQDLAAVPPPSSALQSSRCLAAYSHRSSTATDRSSARSDVCTQRRDVCTSLGSTRCPAAAPHRNSGHACDGQAGAEANTSGPARAPPGTERASVWSQAHRQRHLRVHRGGILWPDAHG